MTLIKTAATAVTVAALLAMSTVIPAAAQDKTKMDHSGHGAMKMDHSGHGTMKMEAPADVTEAEAKGTINSVDAEGGKINITHEPVEAIGWPKMTMDLPVTRRVDLSQVKLGAPVTFKLKKGRDNQFRITEITPAE